jgi:hypothetical protein
LHFQWIVAQELFEQGSFELVQELALRESVSQAQLRQELLALQVNLLHLQ